MKLELNDDEINEAIQDHVKTMGIDITGKTVTVELRAGRTVNGNTATVTILKKVESVVAASAAPKTIEDIVDKVEEESDEDSLFSS